MKTSSLFFAACLVTLISACQKQSVDKKVDDVLPSGCFSLAVDDTVFDAFRMTSLEVYSYSKQSDTISYAWDDQADSQKMFQSFGMRQARLIIIASRIVDPVNSNTLIHVSFTIKSSGQSQGVRKDGSLSLGGNMASSGSRIFPVSSNTKLADFINVTAANGFYNLEKPLEIGRMDKKVMTLMVNKQMEKHEKAKFDDLPTLEPPR